MSYFRQDITRHSTFVVTPKSNALQ